MNLLLVDEQLIFYPNRNYDSIHFLTQKKKIVQFASSIMQQIIHFTSILFKE